MLFESFDSAHWQRFMPYEFCSIVPQPTGIVLLYSSQEESVASEILEANEESLCVVNVLILPANLPGPDLNMVENFPGKVRDLISKYLQQSEGVTYSIRMLSAIFQ